MIPPVVEPGWLHQHRDEVVVADVRWYLDGRSGAAAYASGHLEGAVFVDIDRALAAAPGRRGRHPLPEPEAFAAAMRGLGLGDSDAVVAYDDAGGVMAARLVWMLRATGHDAALLDGGIGAWDGPLSVDVPTPPPGTFSARPWPPASIVSIDEVAARPAGVLLDARAHERYLGAPDSLDPRAGHIPGARSLPCRENLDAGGRLLPAAELRRRFAAVGVDEATTVISYCGSGVTACHNLLALEAAGLPPGRLYPGSWSEWSRDPERPAALGEEPG